jgi:protein-tyrosine-phosphatase
MPATVYHVLFLCTGNSARSILAEAIMNRTAAGRFRACSAGSRPAGRVHPESLKLLKSNGYNVFDFRSKSWVEFLGPNSPKFDFVLTVCDDAAAETCPVWPGQPMTAHWGVPDPAAARGTPAEIALAFRTTYDRLAQRISAFCALPLESLHGQMLQSRLDDIGRMGTMAAG